MRCLLIGEDVPPLQRLARVFRELGWDIHTISSLAVDGQLRKDAELAAICTPQGADRLERELVQARRLLPAAIVVAVGDFSVDARMRALALGASDYLPIDVSSRLLSARLSALMRLRRDPAGDVLDAGGLHVDIQYRRIRDDAGELTLSQKEFELLALFVRHIGSTLTRSELMEKLWTGGALIDDNALEVHVSRLRRKLHPRFGGRITTVRGVGYRLDVPEAVPRS